VHEGKLDQKGRILFWSWKSKFARLLDNGQFQVSTTADFAAHRDIDMTGSATVTSATVAGNAHAYRFEIGGASGKKVWAAADEASRDAWVKALNDAKPVVAAAVTEAPAKTEAPAEADKPVANEAEATTSGEKAQL
jgi:hypothetical protein